MVKSSVLSRKGSQGVLDIHTLLLCPDPSRRLGDTYRTLGILGKGGFGSVFRVRHLPTDEERAVKVLRKPSDREDLEHVMTEVALLIELDHPNIMKFHEYFEDTSMVYVVTELCTGGNIGELNTEDNTLDEIRLLFRDVVSAVAYLHHEGVAHRDLKFDNCLLTAADNNHRACAKVIDFGLSSIRKVGDSSTCWMKEPVGTVYFVAPEVLGMGWRFAGDVDPYGPECDVWSIGVMLYIVLTDTHPFAAERPANSNVLVDAIRKKPVRTMPLDRASMDPAARELLLLLLEKDPSKRVDAQGALRHRFFRSDSSPSSDQSGGTEFSKCVSPGRTPRISEPGMKSILKRLCSFTQFTRFEQALLTLVAHEAQAREVEDLRAAFVALDSARAGYLTRREFCSAVAARGHELSQSELDAALQALDPDADDKIQYTDWLAATMSPSALTNDTAMRELFNFFDIHGEGKVSKADLREVLGEDVEEDVSLRAHRSSSGLGSVSWPEFQVLLADVVRHIDGARRGSPRAPSAAGSPVGD